MNSKQDFKLLCEECGFETLELKEVDSFLLCRACEAVQVIKSRLNESFDDEDQE